ncbi:progestin and adipoQ receptor family member 3 [Elysia marginata]|uniref:Progestin and adipoQ receptor family member 3 n=1 Tax=Elysia marginata TaxID=1093978 RepID=A0AAV4JQ08_9GAST|nr:progestin and adipoQ receptor family member 3 [Elysia marginata]
MALPLYSRFDLVKNRQAKSQQSSHNLQEDAYHIMEIEIDDHSLKACQTGICDRDKAAISLLKYHEIPDFLKMPYVLHGYRCRLPPDLCMKSLVFWTNETLNIWSHLLGFFIFLLLVLYDNIIALPQINGSLADHFIITLGLFCFMFCMLCSTGYHIFYCHSERASKKWLAVDMTEPPPMDDLLDAVSEEVSSLVSAPRKNSIFHIFVCLVMVALEVILEFWKKEEIAQSKIWAIRRVR